MAEKNLAAVLTAPKTPLEVQEVELYKPGPHEILVKNTAIAFNPIEAKIAVAGIFPVPVPAILGSSYGGTITAIGSSVTNFKVGEKVAVAKEGGSGIPKNEYGAFQRFVIAGTESTSKVPEGVDVAVLASLAGNLPTVVGIFTGKAGLEKPNFDAPSSDGKKGKVLIYGGTSSVGSLSVQYVAQAGYSVVTTTSPKHKAYVEKLGAVKVFDHTQEKETLIKDLIAAGPYDLVVDSISLPATISVTGAVVAAQGGGKVYALLPAFGPETLPEGVTREFGSWGSVLDEEGNKGLLGWAYETYLPRGVAEGKIIALPIEKVGGGLSGINEVLKRLIGGVSGVKLILDPWE